MKIIFQHKIDISPNDTAKMEKKLKSLEKFLKREEINQELNLTAEIFHDNQRHQNYGAYCVELRLPMGADTLYTKATEENLHLAFKKAYLEIKRQLRKRKTKRITRFLKGARIFEKLKNKE